MTRHEDRATLGGIVAEELAQAEAEGDWDSANLTLMRRTHARATALPTSLVEATTRANSACEKIWRDAKVRADFAMVRPALTEVVALQRETAAALSSALGMAPYDALMDGYQRGVTAAVNASVQPVLDRYLTRLRTELSAKGFDRDLLVMQGNGGTISSQLIAHAAVNTVMSGPASGVMAAAYTGRASGHPNLITYDMGGTSTDVGLIENAVPQVSGELELEYAMPIHVPMVDVHTIGAGGGSIARVTKDGALAVGPQSAGAAPGPVCYRRGGTEPTVTDADTALGRLDPTRFAGGAIPLHRDKAEAARSILGPRAAAKRITFVVNTAGDVPEAVLGQVAPGQRVSGTSVAWPGRTFDGVDREDFILDIAYLQRGPRTETVHAGHPRPPRMRRY